MEEQRKLLAGPPNLEGLRREGLLVSTWLAWARNGLIAWMALTLFASVATQLLAAIFGYDAQFSEPAAYWFGRPFYDPWRFLHWGLEIAPVRPWIAFLCILLALVFVLAAFAMLALAGLIPPVEASSPFKSQGGFAAWDSLSQGGLLGAKGLALGAVRRHLLAKPDIVSARPGNVAFVGAPEHTDAAMLATLAAWRGALVLIDARGLGLRLPRQDVIRFAPGRPDSASYNPMLAIRGGAHAWADALLLARSFLQSGDDALIEAFAVVVLDQLLAALPEQRNLAATRRRLSEPYCVLAEICAAWPEQLCSAPTPQSEVARAVRKWRAAPNATADRLSAIDAALALFADGAYAQATEAHQFRFADLVAGDGADSVVISLPPGDAARAAPLFSLMLAQLVMECAAQSDVDQLGRPKQRELLVVVEAQMLQALSAGRAFALLPTHAARNGCHLLAQTCSLHGATRDAFDAITAIGSQTEATSASLSKLGGAASCWRRVRAQKPSWRNWAFPDWERATRPILAPADLANAPASAVLLFVKGLAPILAHAACAHEAQTTFASGAGLSPAPHDWSAAAVSRTDVETTEKHPPTNAAPIGAKIRTALTRRAPPRARTKANTP